MENNSDHLVIEVNLVFGRMLVVLDSTYFERFNMWSESSFNAELRLRSGLLKLLQLLLCCLKKSSDFVAEFLLLEFVARLFFG